MLPGRSAQARRCAQLFGRVPESFACGRRLPRSTSFEPPRTDAAHAIDLRLAALDRDLHAPAVVTRRVSFKTARRSA